MDHLNRKKAVIYCRVSNVKQTTRGDGLSSQETRCREYARYKGYEVVEVFKDDMTGSLSVRPGMSAMLSFLRKRRRNPHAVIIDDVSRLARGLEAHLQLRAEISGASGILESPSIEFGEDSDSILVENLLASVSQHQRQNNAEQTKNRLRARVLNGYWVFWPPRGFKYEQRRGEGKVLVRDEPLASVVQEALEGYASGRFATQAEVKRFLEAQPCFPKDKQTGEIHPQRITQILRQVLFAGYLEAPSWDVSLRPGRHEGLIDFETYQKIQQRLTEGAKVAARADVSEDFPLRGFVTCGDCGKPLTACWSRGKLGKRYPYYFCFNKSCDSYRKSIKRERLEGAFEGLLKKLQPPEDLLRLARDRFRDLWDERLTKTQETAKTLKSDIAVIEREIEQFLDRIVEATSPRVVAAYEKRIDGLEQQKLLLQEKLQSGSRPQRTFAATDLRRVVRTRYGVHVKSLENMDFWRFGGATHGPETGVFGPPRLLPE